MTQFPPEKSFCRIGGDLLNENRRMCVHAYIISGFRSGGEEVFQARGRALGCLVEEKLDESLVRLMLLVEEKMVGSLVRWNLNHAEEKNSPQFGSPKFPLQLTSKG
jgi:hypothetical protein